MRLICISDTHSLHDRISKIPSGNVLIHAGDCTRSGSLPQLDEFTKWLGAQPHKHKILIAGNHDYCFQKYPIWSQEMCAKNGINYLEDEQITIDGLIFYGSPWTSEFRGMTFNASEPERFVHRAKIPEATEVLITHGPALGILDYVPQDSENVGCYPLLKRINELKKLRAHVCGHIHEGYGYAVRESDNVRFANAATCTLGFIK
jgi:Icc-related predicted phosphoesterase